MVNDYKKHDLFGKTLMQKIALASPFNFDFPVTEQACFLYVLQGEFQYKTDSMDNMEINIPANYSLLLNCITSGKQIHNAATENNCEIVIVTFYPEIFYDRELPFILQSPKNKISNKSNEKINNNFLIQKYVEGLLFYFENPSLINEDILILKLKEIILLLSQTENAEAVQLILSQLFSPITYTFKQIIEANLFSQLTIEELAEQTNLSISSFKREFAKLYNNTPASYIKNKKLEKAAELLVASDQRITDIAFDCGFNDLANFTKSFNDKYNASPSGYRQQNR